MTTWSKPLPAIVARPASTAPLRPRPGLHSTSAPCSSAHAATSSSSQAMNVGSSPAAATTRPASQRARSARAKRSRTTDSRPLAAVNAFTGIRSGRLHGAHTTGRPRPVAPPDRSAPVACGPVTTSGTDRRARRRRSGPTSRPWGDVVPWDGSPPLAWHVAADDRWHSPADEVAVRQVRRARGAGVRDPPADPRRRCRAAGVVGRRRRRAHDRRGAPTTRRCRSPARSPAATCSPPGRRPTCRSRASSCRPTTIVLPDRPPGRR